MEVYNTVKSSAPAGITTTSRAYLGRFGVERLRFCDQQLAEIAKAKNALSNQDEDLKLNFSLSNLETLWTTERNQQCENYKTLFEEGVNLNLLIPKDFCLRTIGFYWNKIYEGEHPELARIVTIGTLSSMTFWLLSGVSFLISGVIPLINLSFLTKVYEPIFISQSCIAASIFFFISACACNVGSLFALAGAQEVARRSRKEDKPARIVEKPVLPKDGIELNQLITNDLGRPKWQCDESLIIPEKLPDTFKIPKGLFDRNQSLKNLPNLENKLQPTNSRDDNLYLNTYGILKKFNFCVRKVLALEKVLGPDDQYEYDPNDPTVKEFVRWEQRSKLVLERYRNSAKEMKEHLAYNNIFAQHIWFYSDKIYVDSNLKKDLKLIRLAKRGMFFATASLMLASLSLISCVIIPHINYRISSKVNQPIAVYPLLVVATVLFFTAAYVFNLAFLTAMKVKERVMRVGDIDIKLVSLEPDLADEEGSKSVDLSRISLSEDDEDFSKSVDMSRINLSEDRHSSKNINFSGNEDLSEDEDSSDNDNSCLNFKLLENYFNGDFDYDFMEFMSQ